MLSYLLRFNKKVNKDDEGVTLIMFIFFLSFIALPLSILVINLLAFINTKEELQIFTDASALNASINGTQLVHETWSESYPPSYCNPNNPADHFGDGYHYVGRSYHYEINHNTAQNLALSLLQKNIGNSSMIQNESVQIATKDLYGQGNYVWNGSSGTDARYNGTMPNWAYNNSLRTEEVTVTTKAYFVPLFGFHTRFLISANSSTEKEFSSNGLGLTNGVSVSDSWTSCTPPPPPPKKKTSTSSSSVSNSLSGKKSG